MTLGLLPGGGGVTRTVRMFGIQNAFMNVLSQGTRFKPAQGQGDRPRRRGPADRRGAGARRQGVDQGQPRQPYPALGPEGLQDARRHPGQPRAGGILPSFPALLRKQLKGAPMPAPRAILDAAVEGAQVDFDTASRIESRYFTSWSPARSPRT